VKLEVLRLTFDERPPTKSRGEQCIRLRTIQNPSTQQINGQHNRANYGVNGNDDAIRV